MLLLLLQQVLIANIQHQLKLTTEYKVSPAPPLSSGVLTFIHRCAWVENPGGGSVRFRYFLWYGPCVDLNFTFLGFVTFLVTS